MSLTWFRGAIHQGPLAIDPRDRGLTLGDGLFETLLVMNRTPLWGNMHLARMEAAAHELGIPFARAAVDDAVAAVLAAGGEQHQVLRITLTRGIAARGLAGAGAEPTLLLTLDPFDPALMFKPVTLVTSSVRRSPASLACRLKTLSYIDNIAAAREAASRGAEDAVMLTTSGRVASSTIANLFLMKGETLITPGRDQAILTGVIRQALIAVAAAHGLKVKEREVKPAELLTADAVFLTNSLRLIRPVTAIDRKPVARADLQSLVDGLCETARLQCGRDPRLI